MKRSETRVDYICSQRVGAPFICGFVCVFLVPCVVVTLEVSRHGNGRIAFADVVWLFNKL